MDTPESTGGAENDDPAFDPPAQRLSKQHHTKNVAFRRIKYHALKLYRVGPDRWIELLLTAVIALFALVQLITTTANYSSTSKQTNQLITAANTSASAADKNAKAAKSFADSAQGINSGVVDAVSKLNLQAKATADLAVAAGKQADRALAQANATNALVGAAELGNKNAGLALEVQTRPWLGIEGDEATMKEKPREETGGVYIVFFIKLHNYGQSPAIDIVPWIPPETLGGRYSKEPRSISKTLCDAANQASKTADPEYGPELVVWPGTSQEYRIAVHSSNYSDTYATGCFSYKSRSGDIHDTFFLYRIGMNRGDPQGEDHALRISGIELVSMQPLQ